MAGRVERRINDRFYFVLDEVGSSSDFESGTISDGEVMPSSEQSIGEDVGKPDDENEVYGSGTRMSDLEPNGKNETFVPSNGTDGGVSLTMERYTNDKMSIASNDSDTKECGVLSEANNTNMAQPSVHDSASGIIDMDCESEGESGYGNAKESVGPIFKITFRDEKIKKNYRSSLMKYLTQKIQPCTIVTNSENNLEIDIYKEENEVLDFQLDTTPTFELRSNRVPSYGKHHDVLLGDIASHQTENQKNEASTAICFNCCGNHTLRECPHERQIKVINRNRSKFQAQNKMSKNRYHLDENQKFGNFVPGELSKKLRNALGLKKEQQPVFIYRMRLLGYPPAWLEEARVSHSGVIIYDSKGTPVLEEGDEEGEIISDGAKDRFDISKIIDFPGFNVPLPNNMKEEGSVHSCPPMSADQSKENLIRTLEPNAVQAYKKKSSTLQKYSCLKETDNTVRKRLSSPTIEEMEEKKRLLLLALNDEEDVSDNKAMQEEHACPDVDTSMKISETLVTDVSSMKNLQYGTPVLKSISPFSKLPSRKHFSSNVSDVINFENLPNSTGKYETMSSLIMKIRDTVSRIQNE